MKNSVIAFSVASVLVTSLTVFVFKTGIVAALTATSTSATTTATSTAIVDVTDNATSTASVASSTSSVSRAKGKPALKRVHVVGSKYVDFFTDGTTTYSFPGDPLLDANLNKS